MTGCSNKIFLGVVFAIAVLVMVGCTSSAFDGCLFNSTCSSCGAACIKSGFHAGDCEYNHKTGCKYLVVTPEPTTPSTDNDKPAEDTTPSDYSSARALTQSIVSRSDRCGRLTVPNKKPTIRIKRYDINGPIEFESSLGSGTITNTSAHREYMILTQNSAGKVGDSASSHGYKDSRWNKYWGNDLRRFCIIMMRDNRGSIEEWSETITVR